MLKNRECWRRFLSLHGESTCLAPPGGGGNGSSKILLCRSVAQLGGAQSIFRCVPIIRRDRWPPGLVTRIYNSSQHRLNDTALHRSSTKGDYGTDCEILMVRSQPQPIGKKAELRRKNSRITNLAADQPKQKWLRRGKHGCLSNSVTPALIYQERFLIRLCCYLSAASLFAGTPFWPLGG